MYIYADDDEFGVLGRDMGRDGNIEPGYKHGIGLV